MSQAKGVFMLLTATTYLSREDWRLKIAGLGPDAYVAELKRQFQDPRIEWLGFTENRSFYASIDVTVVPSLWGILFHTWSLSRLLRGRQLSVRSPGASGIVVAGEEGQDLSGYGRPGVGRSSRAGSRE